MRVAVRALLVAVATAGAAAEVWAVHQGWSWVSAALDLLVGWSLVAAAGWAAAPTRSMEVRSAWTPVIHPSRGMAT